MLSEESIRCSLCGKEYISEDVSLCPSCWASLIEEPNQEGY